jgi:hypothetical protein
MEYPICDANESVLTDKGKESSEDEPSPLLPLSVAPSLLLTLPPSHPPSLPHPSRLRTYPPLNLHDTLGVLLATSSKTRLASRSRRPRRPVSS